jgi:hypothetical protein
MESSFKIYPDRAVKIGDSWTVDTKMQMSMPIETITQYTLKEVQDGIAILSVKGTLVSKGNFEVPWATKWKPTYKEQILEKHHLILKPELYLTVTFV